MKSDRVPGLDRPQQLNARNLCPGDLIYTYSGAAWERSSRHVVVYVSGDRVLHSSSSRGGVGADPLSWLHKYRLHGVYRPLGCQDELPASGTTTVWRASQQGTGPDERAAVQLLVGSYFATWVSRDLAAYRRFWSADAVQWTQGGRHGLEEILRRRKTDFDGLQAAHQSHNLQSLAIFGEHALVEVVYDLHRIYVRHSRDDSGVKESFVLRRVDSRWLIAHNETYLGD